MKNEHIKDIVLSILLGIAIVSIVAVAYEPEKKMGHRETRPIAGTAACHAAMDRFLDSPIESIPGAHQTISEKVRSVCRDPVPQDCRENKAGPIVMYSDGSIDDSRWDSREYLAYCEAQGIAQ